MTEGCRRPAPSAGNGTDRSDHGPRVWRPPPYRRLFVVCLPDRLTPTTHSAARGTPPAVRTVPASRCRRRRSGLMSCPVTGPSNSSSDVTSPLGGRPSGGRASPAPHGAGRSGASHRSSRRRGSGAEIAEVLAENVLDRLVGNTARIEHGDAGGDEGRFDFSWSSCPARISMESEAGDPAFGAIEPIGADHAEIGNCRGRIYATTRIALIGGDGA